MYCVLECVRICHYDDVQVQVCNNASMCTSVNQHERIPMFMHYICVSCKEITNRNHCNRRRVSELSKDYGKLEAVYTTRGLCECVANSLTRAVFNTAMGDARLLQPLESVNLA